MLKLSELTAYSQRHWTCLEVDCIGLTSGWVAGRAVVVSEQRIE